MTTTEKFCNILRERSREHMSAGRLVFTNGHFGQLISILRQELDSLILLNKFGKKGKRRIPYFWLSGA